MMKGAAQVTTKAARLRNPRRARWSRPPDRLVKGSTLASSAQLYTRGEHPFSPVPLSPDDVSGMSEFENVVGCAGLKPPTSATAGLSAVLRSVGGEPGGAES